LRSAGASSCGSQVRGVEFADSISELTGVPGSYGAKPINQTG